MLHPAFTAPTRDPAWYTWRAAVVLRSDPGSVAAEWGPRGIFSGGYRVAVPMMGALLQRVAGVDPYSFTSLMMVAIPVLTGMALAAAAYRGFRDGLAIPMMMLAAAALFLSQPYIGYLDDATVLFLLSLSLAFVGPSRTSWGARLALVAIGLAVAFVHPTSAALFGITLLAVAVFHFFTARFKLAAVVRSDGPMLLSVGAGMLIGLACWPLGIWGATAKFSDAALPPPYSQTFFMNRLGDWLLSMRPLITGPLILVAIASAVWASRKARNPVEQFRMVSAWWLLPLLGTLTFVVSSAAVPYYRFVNATAAPIALAGTGAFISVRWLLGRRGRRRLAGALATSLIAGSLAWMVVNGLDTNWVAQSNQWATQSTRASLAAMGKVVSSAGPRPIVLIMNYGDQNDPTDQTNTAYGWAKTYTNIFRAGIPGEFEGQQATYVGKVGEFLAGRETLGRSDGYNKTSSDYWGELQLRERQFPEQPVVFVLRQFYKGATPDEVTAAMAQGSAIGPDIVVLNGPGLYQPSADDLTAARAASDSVTNALANHPGALSNPLHNIRVLFGLLFLIVLPGLIAAPAFDLEGSTVRVMLVPGMSIVLSIIAGIAVLAVWRGPLTTPKGWTVVAASLALAAALRLTRTRLYRRLDSAAAFFSRMFEVFSNRSFAALMTTQFLAQGADGMVQASLAKTIAFGGKKGFDLTTAPSTRYLLVMVLLLYVPYTLISPFVGVLIDRIDRTRLLSASNFFRAGVVGAAALALAAGGSSLPAPILIGAILIALACTRILLAIKSAGLPVVLHGEDLLQANGLSQAGGAVFQVLGGGIALVGTAIVPSWSVALVGAALYGIAGLSARRVKDLESEPHAEAFAGAMRSVISQVRAGLREVFSSPAAALGLTAFQALRMEFFGFVALVFALQARVLLTGPKGDKTAVAIAAATGALGAGLGMVAAQKMKDRVPATRMLIGGMTVMGVGVVAFGGVQTIAGYSMLTFAGAMGFFLGKISSDTIMQGALPDGFRGRGFSLFDIAYNLGWIVPSLVLAGVWGDGSHVRAILISSGVVFLGLTAVIARWASKIFGPEHASQVTGS